MPATTHALPPNAATVEVAVRWSDMDAYGHVNNVQYLRYLEEARVYAFHEWFGQERSLLEDGVLVARTEIDYLAPMTFNYEPALVTLWCSRISGAAFDISYVVGQRGSDLTFARAESTLVTYELSKGRPRRIAEHERAAMKVVLGDPLPLRSHKDRR
ncbi:acyl-CoA thioesterase [Ornithinimicrobium cryptoxanthini]|uniref:Acyl-CoA thioesterase n=1 Tax=Ornithinimicrobium cryptoxanthini TaxID=2934161 RepID=A0ABY4YFN7_9MICO|nr:thioesterase family protein [Ornithinimicrobium cryptoxanthini]USQ75479.1 acyl-CoA thioesterase [Ornithinimicrobium cryptoxanthini]